MHPAIVLFDHGARPGCGDSGGHDVPVNPDDPAYVRRQYAWFQAQDARRQQQLRKLHSDFMQLDADTRTRLTKVMQNYNLWLAKLPAATRERIFSRADAGGKARDDPLDARSRLGRYAAAALSR